MDIAMLSMNLSQMNLKESVGISLLKMNMDDQLEISKNITENMNTIASDENMGNNIDCYA